MAGERGRVILAATPIGRVDDASARLRAALASASVIAAEDTRRLRRLCAELGVAPPGKIVSHFDANEVARLPLLLDVLSDGGDVLVVTDAGLPAVSDPGYRLVRAALDAGHEVTALPGPSAVTTALIVSGLPVDRFCFEGFLPRRPGQRRNAIVALADEPRTLVLFEAPHRLAATLTDLAAEFGADRPAAVCRELTKTHEEVLRAPLGELAAWAARDPAGVRGEITLVIGGALRPSEVLGTEALARQVADREAAGQDRKDAIADVARTAGVPKRAVFDAVVAAKAPPGPAQRART